LPDFVLLIIVASLPFRELIFSPLTFLNVAMVVDKAGKEWGKSPRLFSFYMKIPRQ
jgi:hypothetical protein